MAFSLIIVCVSVSINRGDSCILGEGTGVFKALTKGCTNDTTAVPALYHRRVRFAVTLLLVLCPAFLRQPARHGPECLGWGEGGKGQG